MPDTIRSGAASDGWDSREVASGGATIAAQSLGEPGRPALLLLNAATWSRDWWPDAWCATLAEAGLRVIRFDTRDTGASTSYPPGEPGYTSADLGDDAIAVLDAFDVDRAVLVGLSMGGGLAQLVATQYRERVAGLVLMSTSPADDADRGLPGPTSEIMATFTGEPPDPDWADRDAVVEWVVNAERPYAGPGNFDEDALRELAGRVWDRTVSMPSASANHFAIADGAAPIDLAALRDLPALVVHGTADPMFPPEHGRALADALDARLLLLDDVGHQVPPPHTWPEVTAAIAELVGSIQGRSG